MKKKKLIIEHGRPL